MSGCGRFFSLVSYGHRRCQPVPLAAIPVEELGNLVLSQQADMQVQVSPLFGRRVHAVLGDEDERRKKDGFLPKRSSLK